LTSSWLRRTAVARKWPMPAPIWTVGPSRPRASPAPIASTPPKNFTGIRISGGGGSSSRRTASTSGMPLPFAPGANFRTSLEANPVAMAETPITSAKPPISVPCAQSMTAFRKRSDCSRTSRKTLPTRPDSPPTANAKSARTSRLPCSCAGLGS